MQTHFERSSIDFSTKNQDCRGLKRVDNQKVDRNEKIQSSIKEDSSQYKANKEAGAKRKTRIEELRAFVTKLERGYTEEEEENAKLDAEIKKVKEWLNIESQQTKQELKEREQLIKSFKENLERNKEAGVIIDLAMLTEKLLWIVLFEKGNRNFTSLPDLQRISDFLHNLNAEDKEKITMLGINLKKLSWAPMAIYELLAKRYRLGYFPGKANKEHINDNTLLTIATKYQCYNEVERLLYVCHKLLHKDSYIFNEASWKLKKVENG